MQDPEATREVYYCEFCKKEFRTLRQCQEHEQKLHAEEMERQKLARAAAMPGQRKLVA